MSGRALMLIGFLAVSGVPAAAQRGIVTGVSASARSVVAGTSVSVVVTGNNPCGAAHIIYGDGTAITYAITGVPVTQTHVYETAGNYTIIARGMGNCDGEATTSITVTPKEPPAQATAPASISDVEIVPRPARVGEPVAVIVRGSGFCPYEVAYGDGSSDKVNRHLPQDTHHTYTQPGSYTVVVRPQAPCVGRFTDLLQVTARAPQPLPRITHVVAAPVRGIVGETISVSVHGSGACPYDLYYGDGKVQQVNGILPQETRHTYDQPGTYTVVAKPHPPCQGNFNDTVHISGVAAQAPRISRVLVAPTPAAVGRPVSITIEGTGTCAFTIDYGDGTWDSHSLTLPDAVRHVYNRGGFYTILAIGDAPCAGSGRNTFRVARGR